VRTFTRTLRHHNLPPPGGEGVLTYPCQPHEGGRGSTLVLLAGSVGVGDMLVGCRLFLLTCHAGCYKFWRALSFLLIKEDDR
jgi:hypothetical protein